MRMKWIGVIFSIAAAMAAVIPAPGQPESRVAIPFRLRTPTAGVRLTGGVLKRVFENNQNYLLHNFAEDDLLYVFRERAGQQNLPGKSFNWDKSGPKVTGSVAGLFLMGSGNSLRWEENKELRRRMNAVVSGIARLQAAKRFHHGLP